MKLLQQIYQRFSNLSLMNGYILVLLVFAVWMTFFDKHNFIDQFKVSKTLSSIEQEIADYEVKYQQALIDQKNLEQNQEKFAREQYNYSEKDEQIFIIK